MSNNLQLLINAEMHGALGSYMPGDIVTVPNDVPLNIAEIWVSCGCAEWKNPLEESMETEIAIVEPEEKAVLNEPKNKRGRQKRDSK